MTQGAVPRVDIARIIARATLQSELDRVDWDAAHDNSTTAAVAIDALLSVAISVKRRRTSKVGQRVGEVIDLTFAVPPDPTEPED